MSTLRQQPAGKCDRAGQAAHFGSEPSMSPTSTVLRSRFSCFTHSSIRLLTAGVTAALMT